MSSLGGQGEPGNPWAACQTSEAGQEQEVISSCLDETGELRTINNGGFGRTVTARLSFHEIFAKEAGWRCRSASFCSKCKFWGTSQTLGADQQGGGKRASQIRRFYAAGFGRPAKTRPLGRGQYVLLI